MLIRGGLHILFQIMTALFSTFEIEPNFLQVIEEEKRLAEFHANPMPTVDGAVRGLPPKKPPTPTRVQPFNLHSDVRGAAKQELFKQQVRRGIYSGSSIVFYYNNYYWIVTTPSICCDMLFVMMYWCTVMFVVWFVKLW